MDTVTINVTMPKGLMSAVRELVASGWYGSISEVVRTGVRYVAQQQQPLTVNGFTPEFEEEVLKAATEPVDYSKAWESDKDIDEFFDAIDQEVRRQAKRR